MIPKETTSQQQMMKNKKNQENMVNDDATNNKPTLDNLNEEDKRRAAGLVGEMSKFNHEKNTIGGELKSSTELVGVLRERLAKYQLKVSQLCTVGDDGQ